MAIADFRLLIAGQTGLSNYQYNF